MLNPRIITSIFTMACVMLPLCQLACITTRVHCEPYQLCGNQLELLNKAFSIERKNDRFENDDVIGLMSPILESMGYHEERGPEIMEWVTIDRPSSNDDVRFILPHKNASCFDIAINKGLRWSALIKGETDSRVRIVLPLASPQVPGEESLPNHVNMVCDGNRISIQARLKPGEERLSTWVELRQKNAPLAKEKTQ